MVSQFLAQQYQTDWLMVQASSEGETCSRKHQRGTEKSSDEEVSGTGSGNSTYEIKKIRTTKHTEVYRYVRNEDSDICLFQKISHMTRDESNGLHSIAAD